MKPGSLPTVRLWTDAAVLRKPNVKLRLADGSRLK